MSNDNKGMGGSIRGNSQNSGDKPKNHPAKTPKNKIKKAKRFILKKFKLSVSIGGYSAGSIIKISCHKNTLVPIEKYWRKRLRDAKVDNCMAPYIEETFNKEDEL